MTRPMAHPFNVPQEMHPPASRPLAWGLMVACLAPLPLLGATYCNPIDINYQYNFEQEWRQISYRAGADPVIVNHKGEYYLFVTISGGWWHSKDLLHWDFVRPNTWPKEDMCAPAALSVGGRATARSTAG